MYGKVNLSISQFSRCTPDVKYRLFNAYCVNLYGTMLWNISPKYLDAFSVAWRKCIRKLLNLNPRTHNGLIPIIVSDSTIDFKIHRQYVNFISNCLRSDNKLVSLCARQAFRYGPSTANYNISYVCSVYNLHRHEYFAKQTVNVMKYNYVSKYIEDGYLIRDFLTIKTHRPFDHDIDFIVDYLCTKINYAVPFNFL